VTISERVRDLSGRAYTHCKRLLATLDPGAPRWLMLPALVAVLVLVIWQVRSLPVDIIGEHNWRQADTYSQAYNFLHESPDFFHPRIDWTNGRSGVMGMETPIYSYTMFLGMAVFGDAPAVGRVVAWLVFMLAIACFCRSLRPFGRKTIAVGLLVMVFFSPMGLYEFRQIQPDGVMVSLCVIAAACFHEYAKTARRRHFVIGMICYTVAVLTKSPALVMGPAMWLFTFTAKPTSWRQKLVRGAWFAVPLVLFWSWNQWAHHLNEAYNDGIVYFAIEFDVKTMLADMTNGGQLEHLFGFVLTSYVCNWVLFPAVLVGAALGFEKEHRPVAIPMLAWLLGAGLFLAAFSSRLGSHWYYATVIFPPLMYFGSLAIGRLFELTTMDEVSPLSRWTGAFLVFVLALAPFVGGKLRELNETHAAAGLVPRASWIGTTTLLLLLVLMAVAYGMANAPPSWRLRWAFGPMLLIAGWMGLERAHHDAREVFKWRTREPQWETADTDTAALRAAVDRFSSRADLFVVDAANPWYLYLPLRKGWADDLRTINEHDAAWYNQRGARFYLHFADNGGRARIVRKQQPLARADRWELFCIDPAGCPELPVTAAR